MKKMYFVQIVYNNENKFAVGCRFLSAYVMAKDKVEAEQIILNHYRQYYTGGDNGRFYVQCNWRINIPLRALIEKHWKKASMSRAGISDGNIEDPHYHYFRPSTSKKEVMADWDRCHISWADPVIHWDMSRGGYSVMIHSHMTMPTELVFFKGTTRAIYDKAKKFVKDNTLRQNYFTPF